MMFWIFVAVLIVIALIIVIVPLLKVKDFSETSREEQNIAFAKDKLTDLKRLHDSGELSDELFNTGKTELENTLALDLENQVSNQQHQGGRWLIYVLILFIPLASTGIYLKLGNPDLLNPKQKLADMQQQKAPDIDNLSVEAVIDLVKKRLNKNPNDGEGWYILGRTLMNAKKHKEAVVAYRRSYELIGDEPNLMLSLADAIAMTQDGNMLGEPEKLVQAAIEIEPNNGIGLWLGGLAAEQRNEIPKAYELWSRLLPLLTDDKASYNEINVMLSQLKETFPELPPLPSQHQAKPTVMVKLSIDIDESVRKGLNGTEQVFVYAKAVSGPPMPLAAKKLKVSDLPIQLTLSEADAMMPQLTLATVDAFTVGARVSMSGNPIPQKGDFFMEVSPLTKDSLSDVINLTIKQMVE